MKEKVLGVWRKVLELLKNTVVRIVAIALAVTLVITIIVTLTLTNSKGYVQLYTGVTDPTEVSEVYSELRLMGADVKLGENNEILVLDEEYDIWLILLAEKGYPKTGAPAYDIILNNAGLTTTEMQYEQLVLSGLQDRLQETIARINGVQAAIVNLNLADDTEYVWENVQDDMQSTAGVMLTLNDGVTLSPVQVTSIKNLVSSSVSYLAPENVVVIDSKTSLELLGVELEELEDGEEDNEISYAENLEFEKMVQSQIEENVEKLLSARYGEDGVVASAKVTIDYDKMISEQLDLLEDEEGNGYATNVEIEAELGTEDQDISDVVGEENNTDIPEYPVGGLDEDEATYYRSNYEIDYGYLKTQIESGQAEISRATISVMVDEENLDAGTKDELITAVAMATDIPIELISVTSYDRAAVEPEVVEPEKIVPENITEFVFMYLELLVAVAFGLILLIIAIIILIGRRKRRKQREKEEALLRAEEEEKRRKEEEIDEYKKQLASVAQTDDDAKKEVIVEEIRDFADQNPEITAGLIRSWLKEEG